MNALSRLGSIVRTIRRDGWENWVTGLGTRRDKTTAGTFTTSLRISDPELRALFHHHDLAKRIVTIRPNEAFREGFKIEADADTEEIEKAIKKWEIIRLFREGLIWGRLYGGCLLVAGVDDGRPMDQPLDPDAPIRSIRYFLLLDKRYIAPASWYENPEQPKYMQVERYRLNTPNGRDIGAMVHESRVIRFGGSLTDDIEKRGNLNWDNSVLQHVYDTIRDAEANWKSVNHLLSDASQAVFKLKGLINMLATPGGEATVRTRMELIDMARSVARAVLLDAEGEDFHREATSFAGVSDVLDRSMMRTSSAAEIPVTILFGRSAAGMNATGDADFRWFYDSIRSWQKQEIEPQLLQVIEWILRAQDGPTNGVVPSDWKICWPRLWQPTPAEQATIEKTQAETAKIYIETGVYLPEEKALALARGGPDAPVEIDESARETMLKNELELAKNGPKDPLANQTPNGLPSTPPVTGGGNPDEVPGTRTPSENPGNDTPGY